MAIITVTVGNLTASYRIGRDAAGTNVVSPLLQPSFSAERLEILQALLEVTGYVLAAEEAPPADNNEPHGPCPRLPPLSDFDFAIFNRR